MSKVGLSTATELAAQWKQDLESWRIPAEIRAKTPDISEPESRRRPVVPITNPVVPPGSISYRRELEALLDGGTVLDVGAGAGGASLPLAHKAGLITAVDSDGEQLEALKICAQDLGTPTQIVVG